jgi:hypothetical protein
MLGVFEFNKRAITCYKHIGFKEIGRRREVRIIGETKYDVIFMDILAGEFESVYVKQFLKNLELLESPDTIKEAGNSGE